MHPPSAHNTNEFSAQRRHAGHSPRAPADMRLPGDRRPSAKQDGHNESSAAGWCGCIASLQHCHTVTVSHAGSFWEGNTNSCPIVLLVPHLHEVGARVCCVAVRSGVAAASCGAHAQQERTGRQAAVCEGEDCCLLAQPGAARACSAARGPLPSTLLPLGALQ